MPALETVRWLLLNKAVNSTYIIPLLNGDTLTSAGLSKRLISQGLASAPLVETFL